VLITILVYTSDAFSNDFLFYVFLLLDPKFSKLVLDADFCQIQGGKDEEERRKILSF